MKIIDDTLKKIDKDGKLAWSRTSLTMASAWLACIGTYLFDFVKNGFNDAAFYAMLGVSLGAKVTDGWTKKLSADNLNSPEIK